MPPSEQPWCSTCPAGWASTGTDAAKCQMCTPGSFAAAPQSPACALCSNGTYAYSWGSTHCNHCIIGTYAPKQVHCIPFHLFLLPTSGKCTDLLEPGQILCIQAEPGLPFCCQGPVHSRLTSGEVA